MPIKWSVLRVSEAVDMIEEYVNHIVEPLEQARLVAREARNIPHLPQYIDQHFLGVLAEIDRAIGDSQWEPVGRYRARIQSIRESLPAEAIEAEKVSSAWGKQPGLV